MREWTEGFLAAFPDLDVEPLSTSGSGRPTGRRFEVRGVTVFLFEGDRIARWSEYWDMATAQRQLGYAAVSADPSR